MKATRLLPALLFLFLFLFLHPSARADQFATGQAADVVLGQVDFNSNVGGTSVSNFGTPSGIARDGSTGKVFISDVFSHRVLRFSSAAAAASGSDAEAVFGQPDFDTGNFSVVPTANNLNTPRQIAFDSSGRLWVADSENHRVLRFDDPANLPPGFGANAVLGQGGFLSGSPSAPSATGMEKPFSVFADAEGTLWVSDENRVLGFRNAAAKIDGAAADLVIGQPNFTSNASEISARGLRKPGQISGGANGSIWVCDENSNRALRYSKVKSPRLTIATRPFTTKKATVPVRGTTAGEVTRVTQRVGRLGPFRKAKGTARWSFNARLKPGRNVVTVVAEGPGGKSAPGRVVLTRLRPR